MSAVGPTNRCVGVPRRTPEGSMRQRTGDGRAWARRRRVTTLALLPAALLVVLSACSPSGRSEPFAAPDGYPEQAPDGYPSPQVMAEMPLVDGATATAPQTFEPAEALPPVTSTPVTPTPVTPTPVAAAATTETQAVAPPDSRAVQRLGDESKVDVASLALARIRLDWRAALPGWQLRFLPARAGVRGATYPDRRVIEIYVRSGDTDAGLAHVIAHELGHAVDVSRLDAADRAAWKSARGIDVRASWFPAGSATPDFATPAGDWAESFARWQTDVGWFSKVGPPPDASQTVLIAQLAGLA